MIFNCAYTELVDIDLLQPNPRNANKHPEKQIEMLAKIIKYQGQRHPIVVSKRSGFINAGHGRLLAMKLLGWSQVAVDYQDFESEAQEYASLIADNKIAELAEHDDSLMLETMKELELLDFDTELLGLVDFSFDVTGKEIKNTGAELNVDDFDDFDHQCPKCNFEWND